jgi:methylmalonyl-CoA mutase N-terminal domain/subunit
MTINSTAAILLALYWRSPRSRASLGQGRRHVQNDVLKEYIARGTYIYPPAGSMRIVTDIFAFCSATCRAGTRSRSAATTSARRARPRCRSSRSRSPTASPTCRRPSTRPRRRRVRAALSFFFNVHNNFFEEIAKFRAARRMWARIMRERFRRKNRARGCCASTRQTAGSSLTAQQPINNVVRDTIQALPRSAAARSRCTPTASTRRSRFRPRSRAHGAAHAAVIAYESGSPTRSIRWPARIRRELTDEIERRASEYIDKIDKMGGAVAAIETGFPQREIQQAAYSWQKSIETKDEIVVGVNQFQVGESEPIELLRIPPEVEAKQVRRLTELKARRDNTAVKKALTRITRRRAEPKI